MLAALLFAVMASAGTAVVRLRDAVSGAPINQARFVALAERGDSSDQLLRAQAMPDTGLHRVTLVADVERCRVQAEGYRALAVSLTSRADALPITVLLEPESLPAPFRELADAAGSHPTAGWVQGYVRDAASGTPLIGAWVDDGHAGTRTDERGYFALPLGDIQSPPVWPGERPLPREFTLGVDAAGYPPWQRDSMLRLAGIQTLLVALDRDKAGPQQALLGARDRIGGDGVMADDGNATRGPAEMAGKQKASLAATLAPPSSIRVGYADAACTMPCCTGSCTHSCVLPLETYVRRGLDSEWIASWNAQSLRAGSIAYRSYGAARTQNPMNTSFDICSSACCQVNDAGTHASTDAAVARTPGLMLSRQAGQVFAAEYSAENNAWDDPGDGLGCSNVDLSCGDGFVGSPSPGWPCLADAVAVGRGCFGHGRGMSQWGSQRWAIHDTTPQNWRWIVDHYYNDNGDESGAGSGLRTSELTSPLSLSAIVAVPAQASAGTLLSLSALAASTAGETHQHLLIGASLYASGVGYIDDQANDASLVLDPGSHLVARGFSVPPGTPPGSYDVLYALWLDVDEDGVISSIDLPLAMVSEPAAFSIPHAALFANGFEGVPRQQ